MSFLTFSLFLGGLAATVIPVLLHLLMRGKPKRLEFPALQLIRKRLEVTKKKLRLKQLLLLAMRMLILILLGLLLAQPSVKLADWFPSLTSSTGVDESGTIVGSIAASLGSQDAPISAALVFDTSLRMDYAADSKNRIEAAATFAEWVVGQLPPNSRIAIIDGRREPAAFQVDPYAAIERIRRLSTETTGREVAESVLEAIRLLEESGQHTGTEPGPTAGTEQRELYVFTDLTEPGWTPEHGKPVRDLLESFRAGKDTELGVFVIDIGVEALNDSGIAMIRPSEQSPPEQVPVRLDVELIHCGAAEERTLELLVERDGTGGGEERFVRLNSRLIRFAEGYSSQEISFEVPGFPPGTHQGFVRLGGTDPLAGDDRVFFTLRVHPAWNVLLVAAGAPASEMPEVFTGSGGTEEFDHAKFVREILDPAVMRRDGTSPFRTETATPEQLARMSLTTLASTYRAILLLDPPPLKVTTWNILADYASQGGGVGVFLGRRATNLESFADPIARELLGATPIRQVRAADDRELRIVPRDYVSPIYATFRPLRPAETPWSELPVLRYWELRNPTDRAMIEAQYSDGRAAILTQSLGRGRTLLMGTPLSDPPHATGNTGSGGRAVEREWNDLTTPNWVSLALIDGMTRFLVGASDRVSHFTLGQPAVIRLDGETLPESCLLSIPVSESREGSEKPGSVRLAPDAADRSIRYPGTEVIGNYRIRSGGTQGAVDTGFSVNPRSETWNLRRIGKSGLDAAFGEGGYRLARTPAEVEIGIARRRIGQELYTPILLLLCGVFLSEYLFSNYFHGRESRTDTQRERTETG